MLTYCLSRVSTFSSSTHSSMLTNCLFPAPLFAAPESLLTTPFSFLTNCETYVHPPRYVIFLLFLRVLTYILGCNFTKVSNEILCYTKGLKVWKFHYVWIRGSILLLQPRFGIPIIVSASKRIFVLEKSNMCKNFGQEVMH